MSKHVKKDKLIKDIEHKGKSVMKEHYKQEFKNYKYLLQHSTQNSIIPS